jgi:hypothetical protein
MGRCSGRPDRDHRTAGALLERGRRRVALGSRRSSHNPDRRGRGPAAGPHQRDEHPGVVFGVGNGWGAGVRAAPLVSTQSGHVSPDVSPSRPGPFPWHAIRFAERTKCPSIYTEKSQECPGLLSEDRADARCAVALGLLPHGLRAGDPLAYRIQRLTDGDSVIFEFSGEMNAAHAADPARDAQT